MGRGRGLGGLQTSEEDLLARKHAMVLAERGGDRRLPIWIGPAEATALALVLESATPTIYDL